jgi:uncharacterized protein YgiM (DUF1202 family)
VLLHLPLVLQSPLPQLLSLPLKNNMRILGTLCSPVLLMLALTASSFADEQFPFLGETSKGPVNVRAGANTNFEVVDKLNAGAEVVILGKAYEWFKIQLPQDAAAYVRADYIKEVGGSIGEMTGNKVNVRAKPGSEASTLGQLQKGDLIKLIEKSGEWWKIEPPPSTYAWIHSDFIKVKTDGDVKVATRKALTQDSIPVPKAQVVMLEVKGKLEPAPLAVPGAKYQIVSEGKPTYYLQDTPHLDRFNQASVNVEGAVIPGGTDQCPLLSVRKISFVL